MYLLTGVPQEKTKTNGHFVFWNVRAFVTLGAVVLFGCHKPEDVEQSATVSTPVVVVTPRISIEESDKLAIRDSSIIRAYSTQDTLDPAGQSLMPRFGIFTAKGHAVPDLHRLLVFDSLGYRIGASGRDGAGPGEYRSGRFACETLGDTLVMFDNELLRVSVLSAEGVYQRQFPVRAGILLPHHGCLRDGTILVKSGRGPLEFDISRYDLTGRIVSTFPLRYDRNIAGNQLMVETAVVASKQSIFYGDPWKPEINEFTLEGKLRRIYRFADWHPPKFDRENAAPYILPKTGTAEVRRAQRDHYPYFKDIRVSPNGTLWTLDFPTTRPADEHWVGFDTTGRIIASLTISASLVAEDVASVAEFGDKDVLLRLSAPNGGVYFKRIPLRALKLVKQF